MLTDLFIAASGVALDAVSRAVPPACRRPIESAAAPVKEGADVVIEFPEWRPRQPARHLLPAWSLASMLDCAFRFELSVARGGAWSPWVVSTTIGSAEFAPATTSADGLEADVDVFTTATAVDRVRLRIRLRAGDADAVVRAPWLATLSACDLAGSAARAGGATSVALLNVPARTQLAATPEIAMRICSPTSVAMVLDYWGERVDTEVLAGEMFDRALDCYGVWPAAIRAAARRGVMGYLLRFPDWASAAWCLERSLPIVVSLRYKAGELTGAAMPATDGHLVVLVGFEGDDVLVNDPVAPSAATVPRRCRRDQLLEVWLGRAGVGYVFFKPPPPTP